MKRPQPDLTKTIVDAFISTTGSNRKLKRLWGTTTVNGVEVLNSRRYYHKEASRPDNYERLFKFLKVWKDIKDYKGEGVKSAWFVLNKSNSPEDLSVPTSFISDNINRMWWDTADGVMPEGLTLTTTLTISENFQNTESVTGINWGDDKETIAQYVVDNYETLWRDKKIVQEGVGVINKGSIVNANGASVPDEDDLSPDDPWLSVISRYALRDSGIPCTVKNVEVGIGLEGGLVRNTLVVTLEIPYVELKPTDAIVVRIDLDLDRTNFPNLRRVSSASLFNGFSSSNENLTQVSARVISYYETVDDVDDSTVTRSYLQWEDSIQASIYDNFWVNDGDIYYLKADVIDNPKSYGTTHVELNTYIFSLLDTGYKKEKVDLWKKVVAVVIFIVVVVIAIILSVPTGGWSLTWPAVVAAAFAVSVGSLVISLVVATLSALGFNEWASAFAWVSKEIEPLVTVASIILVVDIIATMSTVVGELGVKEAVSNIITDMAKDFATGLSDLAAGNVSMKAVSVLNKSVSAYTSVQLDKLETINSRNKDLEAEYEDLLEETSRDSDIMMGYMNIYAKPATADWSIYSSTFDLPYERGGGTLSMGNVQKTTKKALRPAEYREPMFEGFLLM